MINFDNVTEKKKIKKHNAKGSQVLNHPYRILITEGYGSE